MTQEIESRVSLPQKANEFHNVLQILAHGPLLQIERLHFNRVNDINVRFLLQQVQCILSQDLTSLNIDVMLDILRRQETRAAVIRVSSSNSAGSLPLKWRRRSDSYDPACSRMAGDSLRALKQVTLLIGGAMRRKQHRYAALILVLLAHLNVLLEALLLHIATTMLALEGN